MLLVRPPPAYSSGPAIRDGKKCHSFGKAKINHLLHKLKAFGLFLPCTSKYLSGIAIDGQYTSLIEEKHNMHEKLQNISNLGWDLVHMIEVINEIMSMFKT